MHHAVKLPDLLRAWRATAGKESQSGKPLPQKEVAQRMAVSERWYRSLESDAGVPLTPEVLNRLATALTLGTDERLALFGHVYVNGGHGSVPAPKEQDAAQVALARWFTAQEHLATYRVDHAWNVVGHSETMATWFPWVLEPGANLLRWALTTPAAREQLADWPMHAAAYLSQLRFSLATTPHHEQLSTLLDELLEDPECRALWEREPRVLAYRQGHVFKLRLPHVSDEDIIVTSQILLPAYQPEIRHVLLLPL
ncbi:helix-turn-helix domain-containing protein [Streptomyces sp. NPDC050844]|uniref:MmyB family transcriptional regulator n=1 Tax=Streptomyces sp. NPDC050844 TaxID=3155790 RepID=UPI0033F1C29E